MPPQPCPRSRTPSPASAPQPSWPGISHRCRAPRAYKKEPDAGKTLASRPLFSLCCATAWQQTVPLRHLGKGNYVHSASSNTFSTCGAAMAKCRMAYLFIGFPVSERQPLQRREPRGPRRRRRQGCGACRTGCAPPRRLPGCGRQRKAPGCPYQGCCPCRRAGPR